jgi:type I restriction enzyme M protein
LSSEERWNESFDVVLANPPFMSPKGGIRPHKKFTIKSNRSEVLFVDYIAEHLNPKGRAGIIVPEGVIFQSGTAYKDLRKMLVDNYLYAVVSLPAGVFNPYSGVKTSILLMDKEFAKTSNEILFVKIDNDGFNLGAQRTAVKGGQLTDAIELLNQFKNGEVAESKIAHAVLKTEIGKNGEFNLNGGRYKLSNIDSTDYELVKLGDVCQFIDYRGKTPTKTESGIPLITAKNVKKGFIQKEPEEFISPDDFDSWMTRGIPQKGDVLITTEAPLGNVAQINTSEKIALAQRLITLIPNRKILSDSFLKEILLTDTLQSSLIDNQSGSTVYGIKASILKQIQIPLPPLSVQEEIVAEIEDYQKIIDGAKMVVENYKPKIDIAPEWEIKEFADAPFEIIDGDRGVNYPKKDDFSDEGYCLFLNTKNVRADGFNFNELMFITKEKDEALRKGKLQREDVLLTTRGTVGNTAYYGEYVPFDHIRINSGMLIFRTEPKILNPEYLYYFFQSENCQTQFKKIISGAAQPQLPIRDLKSAKIPIPDLKTQIEIVKAIKKEQDLVSANAELQNIFEQKIKSCISKVWGE